MKRNGRVGGNDVVKKRREEQRFVPWLLLSRSDRDRIGLPIPIEMDEYCGIRHTSLSLETLIRRFTTHETRWSHSFRRIMETPLHEIIKEYVGVGEKFTQYDLAVPSGIGLQMNTNIIHLMNIVNRSNWDYVHRFKPTYMATYPPTLQLPIINTTMIGTTTLQQWQTYALSQLINSTIHRRVEHPANIEYKTNAGTLVFSPNGRFYETSSYNGDDNKTGIVPSVDVHGAMICSPTGTGKTITAVAFIDWLMTQELRTDIASTLAPGRRTVRTCAIIVPPHVLQQWETALSMLTSRKVARVYDKSTLGSFNIDKLDDFDVILLSLSLFTTNRHTKKMFDVPNIKSTLSVYDIHSTYMFRNVIFRCTVFDEVHTIECPRIMQMLSDSFASTFNLLMTATPRFNDLERLAMYANMMFVVDEYKRPLTRLPLSSFEHAMFEMGTKKHIMDDMISKFISRDLLRASVFSRTFLNTETVSNIVLARTDCHFYDTSLMNSLSDNWFLGDRIFEHTSGRFFHDHVNDLVEYYIERSLNGMLYYSLLRPEKINDMRNLVAQGKDRTVLQQLGRLVQAPSNDVSFPEEREISPIQVAAIRLIYDKLVSGGRPMVYCENEKCIEIIGTVLKNLGIHVLKFAGPLPRLNTIRRQFESQEKRTVLILHRNHVDGSDFPSVSCILVIGPIRNRVNYKQALGRVTRFMRTSTCKVIPVIHLVSTFII